MSSVQMDESLRLCSQSSAANELMSLTTYALTELHHYMSINKVGGSTLWKMNACLRNKNDFLPEDELKGILSRILC